MCDTEEVITSPQKAYYYINCDGKGIVKQKLLKHKNLVEFRGAMAAQNDRRQKDITIDFNLIFFLF